MFVGKFICMTIYAECFDEILKIGLFRIWLPVFANVTKCSVLLVLSMKTINLMKNE